MNKEKPLEYEEIIKKYDLPKEIDSEGNEHISEKWVYEQCQTLENFIFTEPEETIITEETLKKYYNVNKINNYINDLYKNRWLIDGIDEYGKNGYKSWDIKEVLIPKCGETIGDAKKRLWFVSKFQNLYSDNTRLCLIILIYLLNKGDCELKYSQLVKELEEIEDPYRNYLFYLCKSQRDKTRKIIDAVQKIKTVIDITENGHKFKYVSDKDDLQLLCKHEGNKRFMMIILDAIIKYRGCDPKTKSLILYVLRTYLKVKDIKYHHIKIINGRTKNFNYETLEKVSILMPLKNTFIKFYNNSREIHFKLQDIVEYNDNYYIVGILIPERYDKDNFSNFIAHYNINNISKINKSHKNSAKFNDWIINKIKDLLDEKDVADDDNSRIINLSKKILKTAINKYIENEIIKRQYIVFQIKDNDSMITKDALISYFGDLLSFPSTKHYKVQYNEEHFIEWALPRYNHLEILDENIKTKIEDKIKELYSHISQN